MKSTKLALIAALLGLSLPSAASGQQCNPVCRRGYVCVEGQCVSACNPPCGNGESCVDGDCVAPAPTVSKPPTPPQAPPPAYPPQAPPPAYPPQTSDPQPPQASPREAEYAPSTFQPAPTEKAGGREPHLHDGFYLQFALGLGYASGMAKHDLYDIDVSGVAQLGQLAIGGTIAPGLVIGGGVFGANVFTTKYAVGPKDQANFNKVEGDGELSSASVIGPFVSYYFVPTDGIYAQGGLGVNVMSGGEADSEVTLPETSGTGFGLVVGVGWEGFVSEQWSVGGMFRLTYLTAELEDEDGEKSDFSGWVPGVLFTVTLH